LSRSRRNFVRLCLNAAAAAVALPRLLQATDVHAAGGPRTKLVDRDDRPLPVTALAEGETYVFHYPFVTTPCFLIDTGRELPGGQKLRTREGKEYTWRGGIGPRRSIVAYSAICAHRMSYPTAPVSFISYRNGKARFLDSGSRSIERSQVIYCCSEKSVYDATGGARVLGGPAPQPLAAIALEVERGSGELYAVGTYGGDLFEKFLTDFEFRLRLDHPGLDIRAPAGATARALTMAEYTAYTIACGTVVSDPPGRTAG